MARYQFLCLTVVTVLGLKSCHSQLPTLDDQSLVQDSTLSSLGKELEDNSRYKTLEANATLLKLLVNDKSGVSSSEVFDMLNSRDDNTNHVDLLTIPEDTEAARAEVPTAPNSQAEVLQGPNDVVRKDSQRLRSEEPQGEPMGVAAGIMIVVTCSICCLAYTALIIWRRIYLKRNGLKHELLRNEENIAETRIEL